MWKFICSSGAREGRATLPAAGQGPTWSVSASLLLRGLRSPLLASSVVELELILELLGLDLLRDLRLRDLLDLILDRLALRWPARQRLVLGALLGGLVLGHHCVLDELQIGPGIVRALGDQLRDP